MKKLPADVMDLIDDAADEEEFTPATAEAVRLALSEAPELAAPIGQPRWLSWRIYCAEHILIETTPGIAHVLPYTPEGVSRLCYMIRDEFAGRCAGSC